MRLSVGCRLLAGLYGNTFSIKIYGLKTVRKSKNLCSIFYILHVYADFCTVRTYIFSCYADKGKKNPYNFVRPRYFTDNKTSVFSVNLNISMNLEKNNNLSCGVKT